MVNFGVTKSHLTPNLYPTMAAPVRCGGWFGATRAVWGGLGSPAGHPRQLPFRASRA